MNIYKLLTKGLGSRVNARVTGGPDDAQYSFKLHRHDETIAASESGSSRSWDTPPMDSGKYHFTCTVQTSSSREVISSLPFDFGINKQALKPRALKARPVHQPPASFHSLLYWESRKAFNHRENSAWLLDEKLNAYTFAERLGLQTPALELQSFSYNQIPLERNTVVKPLTGVMSQGVFLITSDAIIDLVNNQKIATFGDLRHSMKTLVENGTIKEDRWIRERLILDDKNVDQPARDIKFYTFYGQPLLALETARIPKVQRCWYDNYSNLINTGKYSTELFVGYGIPAEFYEIAARISKNIPAPFVRVDLLASPDGAVVNEITPKPGGAHLFAASIDKSLGNHLVSADARLRTDLISGKTFDHFKSVQNRPANI
ncbi:ATP-grasp fold amidoligase family protein [Glutamicibacter ardleyensis]|uniref:ATP-grasp fold amidoligase family protein n=1 Tax=Glutamicibacter ardleyensis TaxID=225894 RepID=UPI003FD21162